MPGEALRDLIKSLSNEEHCENTKNPAANIPNLLDVFLPDSEAQEAVSNLLVDYVFNLCLAIAKQTLMARSAGDPDTNCFKNIFQAFRIEESDARRLSRLAMNAAREADKSRPERSRSQQVNEEYCYLCGEEFLESSEERTSVDHVWPKRAAGTKKKSNLYRCHERCEIPKWDTVGPGDVASLRFAFKESNPLLINPVEKDWGESSQEGKGELLKLLRGLRFAQLRIGVAAKQRYKCFECSRSFLDETRGFSIAKREDNLPWAYTNAIAVCNACHSTKNKHHD
jgi:5-methylcytosine-specific restriction endonuclease McrA